jgi:hypothetical protein
MLLSVCSSLILSSILLPSEFVSCYPLVIVGFSLQSQRWSSPVSGPLASWNCSFVLLVIEVQ